MAEKKLKWKEKLRENNWFFSAGITLVLYLLTMASLYFMTPDYGGLIGKLIHLLVPLVAVMVILGFRDKRRREDENLERSKKRLQMHKTLSKFKNEDKKRGIES